MAYSDETVGGYNVIQYYWTKSSLFNRANQQTLLRAKTIFDKDGSPMVDAFGLTEDEEGWFLNVVKDAINHCFFEVRNITTDVMNAININETLDINGADIENCYGFRIRDHARYNDNNKELVDRFAELMIINYVLWQWYKTVGLAEDEKKYTQEYMRAKVNLIDSLYEFRLTSLGS